MKFNLIKIYFLFMVFSLNTFGQDGSSIDQILPLKDIDQTYEKIQTTIASFEFMVHVDVMASMKNYDDCSRNDRTTSGLIIEIDWYNLNHETGKMMADLIMNDIVNIRNSFYSSSGFENLNDAKEVEINGGKIWIYSTQKPCVNEITGPTGETKYFTHIRAFVSTGSMILKIDLKANSKPETLEQSLNYILEKMAGVNFSSL